MGLRRAASALSASSACCGGRLLRVLLRRPAPGAERPLVDHRGRREVPVVRRALDVHDDVRDGASGAREALLQLGLVVDVGVDGVLDPRVERIDDRRLDVLEPVLEEEPGECRLEHGGEHVAVLGEALCLLGGEPGGRGRP